jgi:hypothetical protein
MMSGTIAILSLNLTSTLVTAGVVAGTLPIVGATVSTPIVVESPNHGMASGKVLHALVSGVIGMTEANGLWQLNYVDDNNLALTTFSPQAIATDSIGVNAYVSGGLISYAFPDGQILLGRRNVALSTSVTSPRIVFVPTEGRAWGLEPYGGPGSPAEVPNVRGTLEQQAQRTLPQLETEWSTFEVFVNGSGPNYGNPLGPDFADFEATQALTHALYATMFDAITAPRFHVLHESWPSQGVEAGSMLQRGQQCKLVIEIAHPVFKAPLSFVPLGTIAVITVEPVNPGSTDATVITVN